jgi:GAF domain-containing protein
MEHRSTFDLNSAPLAAGATAGAGASRSASASVSAGMAAANALLPKLSEVARFPAEDSEHSLAEMAYRDFEATLQLLAERAQYITGATGAAIALRRGEPDDMLCRASTGSNAPELGALLSTEYGLSGESVRTRQALRCDDAESDPRVNHEGCRRLGIASVVVMPIVCEQQVIGVFELFSGKPHAFEERDVAALQRLSEMVETAVRHAVAAHNGPVLQEPAEQEPAREEGQLFADVVVAEAVAVESPEKTALEKTGPEKVEREPASKSPFFWSSAMRISASAGRSSGDELIPVPFELRDLQKCKACGFPVSQTRTFCVECEEKQWRGQRLPQPGAGAGGEGQQLHQTQTSDPTVEPVADAPAIAASIVADLPQSVPQNISGDEMLKPTAPSESWFVANKYVLGALLIVGAVIGAIVWLR